MERVEDTTFREPWEREPCDPWTPTCVIIWRVMAKGNDPSETFVSAPKSTAAIQSHYP